jgi:hypothetical protein
MGTAARVIMKDNGAHEAFSDDTGRGSLKSTERGGAGLTYRKTRPYLRPRHRNPLANAAWSADGSNRHRHEGGKPGVTGMVGSRVAREPTRWPRTSLAVSWGCAILFPRTNIIGSRFRAAAE